MIITANPADGSPLVFPPALLAALRAARHIVALTGAGVSAESGVPTFREAQTGLWARFDPQELATAEAFERDPRLVWEWYTWRRSLVARAAPNPAHTALAAIERHAPRLTLITQNIDGLHQKAGSRAVIELHGNLARTICSAERKAVDAWSPGEELPPRCPRCGAYLRPDVVWFGEALPERAIRAAYGAVLDCDLMLVVGTSALVYPAAALPSEALAHGAVLVEVNLDETPLSARAGYCLRGPAGVLLPALVAAAWPSS